MGSKNADVSHATEAPLASADAFRSMFERSSVPQSLTRPAGDVLANDAFLEMLGYTRDEMDELGTWQSLTHPDDIALADQYVSSILAGARDSARFEKRFIKKDGGVVWAEVSTTLHRGEDGTPHYFMTTIVDITLRKRALHSLEVSEAKFEIAFRTSPDAVNINRLSDGLFLEINDGFTALTGFTAADVAGRSSVDLGIWADPADRDMLVAGLQADGVVHNLEAQFRRKDGTVTTALMSAQITELEGEPCILSVTRDITSRKYAEDALRVSEGWLQESQRVAALGHYIYDIQADRWDGSDSLYDVLGVSAEYGRDFGGWVGVVHPDDRERLSRYFQDDVLERREPFDIEYRIVRPCDSVERWVHGLGKVDWADDGQPLAMFGIIQDVTESKQAEALLRKSEAAVKERLRVILEPEGDIGTLRLADVIDAPELQLMLDEFSRLIDLGIGVVDLEGNVLVQTGWQDICTKFHRVHSEALTNCLESDTVLSAGVPVGQHRGYHCKNHMWDTVTPIEIGGVHIGNVFLGQYFYDDEPVDYEAFREQARRFGFDEAQYMAALDRVPRFTRETIDAAMSFFARFAAIISASGYATVQLSRTLAQKDALLAEREQNVQRLARALTSIVEIVGQAVETRDPYTAGHQRRVSELAVRISQEMGMTAEQTESIRVASLLHDIGKMSVPAEILSKPGKLAPIEFELIKMHPESGHRIIASAHLEGATAEIVYQHHERCNGSGYPRGLTADELLPESKVIMVADVVEAMMTHRPYRPGLGVEAALAEIERGAGTGYDPDVCQACVSLFRDREFAFTEV